MISLVFALRRCLPPLRALTLLVGLSLLLGATTAPPADAADWAMDRAVWGIGGSRGWYPSLSADGRYLAFTDTAPKTLDDTNGLRDVFVLDRVTRTCERVSVASDGTQGTGYVDDDQIGVPNSDGPSISPDGRYVAFASLAPNLVPGDTNGVRDVFLHDRSTGETQIISLGIDGAVGNGPSYDPVLSADGRSVAYTSLATNLVPGDSITWPNRDIFIHDLLTGVTELATVPRPGHQIQAVAPDVSSDGRYVAYSDWYGVWVRDRQLGLTERVDVGGIYAYLPAISGIALSGDGRYVAFESNSSTLVPGDTNEVSDVFVRDRLSGTTQRISTRSDGTQSDSQSLRPSMSRDGRYVAFETWADPFGETNYPVYVVIADLSTGGLERLPVYQAQLPEITADGRHVAFRDGSEIYVASRTAPDPPLLEPPADLVATDVSTSSDPAVELTWTASASEGVAGYRLHRQADGGSVMLNVGVVTTYRDEEVVFGETCLYEVEAYDEVGNVSGRSGAVWVTPAPPPTREDLIREVEDLREALLFQYQRMLTEGADSYALASLYRGYSLIEGANHAFYAAEAATGVAEAAALAGGVSLDKLLSADLLKLSDSMELPRTVDGLREALSKAANDPFRMLSMSLFWTGLVGDAATFGQGALALHDYPAAQKDLTAEVDEIRDNYYDPLGWPYLFTDDLNAVSYAFEYELRMSPYLKVPLRGSAWTGSRPDIEEYAANLDEAYYRLITRLNQLVSGIPDPLPPGFDSRSVVARLRQVTDQLYAERWHWVAYPAVRTGVGSPRIEEREVALGAVTARQNALRGWMSLFDGWAKVQQWQVIKSGASIGVTIASGGLPGAVGLLVSGVQAGVDLYEFSVNDYQVVKPVEKMNHETYELLTALPQEAGNLWAVADGVGDYLEFQFGTFTTAPPVSVLSQAAPPADTAPTYAVRGVVRDESGKGLAGVHVSAIEENGGKADWTKTGADGSYLLGGLPAGTYTLGTWNLANFGDEWYGGASRQTDLDGAQALAVAVSDRDVSGIDFVLGPGLALLGRVTTAASHIPSGEVLAVDETGEVCGGARIAVDGTYAITALTPGSYRLVARLDGDNQDAWWNGPTQQEDPDGARAPRVTLADQDEEGLDFVIAEATSIAGRVTSIAGDVLQEVSVYAVDTNGRTLAVATTGADGVYELAGLAAGTYRVRAGAASWAAGWYGGTAVLTDPQGASALVISTAEGDVPGANLSLEAGRSISGLVVNQDGAPIAGVALELCDTSGNALTKMPFTTRSGTFGFSALPPGVYTLRTENDRGYGDEWYLDVSRGQDPLGAQAQSLDTLSGDLQGLSIRLTGKDLSRDVSGGWNLLAGGPASDSLGATLFSFAGSSYRSTTAASMEAGKGYWARFDAPATVSLTTVPAPLSVHLLPGWNLIGNATPSQVSLPAGKTAFAFDGTRYLSKTTLEPGEGAWVRAMAEEDLVLAP